MRKYIGLDMDPGVTLAMIFEDNGDHLNLQTEWKTLHKRIQMLTKIPFSVSLKKQCFFIFRNIPLTSQKQLSMVLIAVTMELDTETTIEITTE